MFERCESIRQSKPLFKDDEYNEIVLTTQEYIETGNINGIYISDVEAVCNSYGNHLAERVLRKLIALFCNSEDKVFTTLIMQYIIIHFVPAFSLYRGMPVFRVLS